MVIAKERLAHSRSLFSQQLTTKSQLDEAKQGVASAIGRVNEVRRQIATADKQIAATLREARTPTGDEEIAAFRAKTQAAKSSLLGNIPRQLPDGRVPIVIRYLNDSLNDPYSMKLIKWSKIQKVNRNEQPYWYVRLRLRAKNGFGAYILLESGYYIRRDKVVFTEKL